MPLSSEPGGGETHVSMAGELALGEVAEARRELLACLEKGLPVVLDLGAWAALELPVFQLIEAFERSAARRGIAVRRGEALPAAVSEGLAHAGVDLAAGGIWQPDGDGGGRTK